MVKRREKMSAEPSMGTKSAAAILITGASTGIGRASAIELDRRGFRVFAGVRSAAAANQLRAAASARLTPVEIDVTDLDGIAAAAKTIGEAVGDAGIVGLVNNAGIAVPGPLELLPIESLRRQFEVNVIGQMAVTQAFLPLLRKGRGRIVNISSASGGQASPYLGAYAASKFALEALTDALRLELRAWGIRVSAIEPGPIDTPIWEKALEQAEQMVAGVLPESMKLYEADLAAVRLAVAQATKTALPVERVVQAVVHALTAKRPKTRYFLGWRVRVQFKALRMLPDRLRDRIVRRAIGLP
jgi:NAD(P)-dependent dehydrogenase (short-subunit alcohol dehydrogenase family)